MDPITAMQVKLAASVDPYRVMWMQDTYSTYPVSEIARFLNAS